jgi:hypothetical protein
LVYQQFADGFCFKFALFVLNVNELGAPLFSAANKMQLKECQTAAQQYIL